MSRWKDGAIYKDTDHVAVEAPLSIQICQEGTRNIVSVAVTMRTPGDDTHLALGFLYNEGLLSSYDIIHHIAHPSEDLIRLYTNESIELDKEDRNFYVSSSCGVCGKSSIDKIYTTSAHSCTCPKSKVDARVILGLKERLTSEQSLFTLTGGIHAAAIFTLDGTLQFLMEDVGRHNALDKVVGYALKKNLLPLTDRILLLSGRASFELVQKATMAGIHVIVSVGAPSSMAVDLAKKNGQTLIGFVKSNRFNIYSGHENVR